MKLFSLCSMDICDIRKQLLYTTGILFARRAFNFIYFTSTTCKKTSDIHFHSNGVRFVNIKIKKNVLSHKHKFHDFL